MDALPLYSPTENGLSELSVIRQQSKIVARSGSLRDDSSIAGVRTSGGVFTGGTDQTASRLQRPRGRRFAHLQSPEFRAKRVREPDRLGDLRADVSSIHQRNLKICLTFFFGLPIIDGPPHSLLFCRTIMFSSFLLDHNPSS